MTDTTNDPSTQAPRYRGAFARLVDSIRSQPADDLMPINLDVMAAVRTTEGILPKIAGQKEAIEKQLPGFDIQMFDQLEDRALALGHAQTAHENAQQPPPILPSLSDEATASHDIVLAEATTLTKRGLLPPQALSKLKGGNGYRNLVDDMFVLSDVLKNNWSKISSKTTLTQEELDHLENLADQINQALGIREQMPELQASAARDRQAAYTLFIDAYAEVRAAIAYVRRKEDDIDSIMPSLFAGRGGSKRKPLVEEPAKPPVPVITQPTDIHDAPVTTPLVTPTTNAGSDPKTDATKPAIPNNGPFMH